MAFQCEIVKLHGSDRVIPTITFSKFYDSVDRLSHQEFLEFLKSSWEGNLFRHYLKINRVVDARIKHLCQNLEIFTKVPIAIDDQYGVYPWMNWETLAKCCQWISKMDLLAWDASSDGCYARADFIGRLFFKLKIPYRYLSKISIHSADHLIGLNPPGYNYHIAVAVKLKDDSEWMVDPLINSKPIPIHKWFMGLGVSVDFISKFDPKNLLFSHQPIQWPPKTAKPRYALKRIPVNFRLVGENHQPIVTSVNDLSIMAEELFQLCFDIELIALSKLFPGQINRRMSASRLHDKLFGPQESQLGAELPQKSIVVLRSDLLSSIQKGIFPNTAPVLAQAECAYHKVEKALKMFWEKQKKGLYAQHIQPTFLHASHQHQPSLTPSRLPHPRTIDPKAVSTRVPPDSRRFSFKLPCSTRSSKLRADRFKKTKTPSRLQGSRSLQTVKKGSQSKQCIIKREHDEEDLKPRSPLNCPKPTPKIEPFYSVLLHQPIAPFYPPIYTDEQFTTSLRDAARRGDLPAVQTLIGQSATAVSMENLTLALADAARNAHLPIVTTLLNCGASESPVARGYAVMAVLDTPVETAPHMNSIVQRLLDGVGIDDQSREISIGLASNYGFREILAMLLAANHNLIFLGSARSVAIYNAVRSGDLEILQMLIEANHGVPISDEIKARAITFALRLHYPDIAEYLRVNC